MIIFPFFIHDNDPEPELNSFPPSHKGLLLITALIFFATSSCLFIFACLFNYGDWIENSNNDPQVIITIVKILPWIGSGWSCFNGILYLIRFLIYDKVDHD